MPLWPLKARLDVYVHVDPVPFEGLFRKLDEANQRLALIQEGMKHMPTKSDFDTLLAAVNEATNKIAARIQALIDKLATGGMTAEEEAQVQADLAAAVAQLQLLGADPENPVPPEV